MDPKPATVEERIAQLEGQYKTLETSKIRPGFIITAAGVLLTFIFGIGAALLWPLVGNVAALDGRVTRAVQHIDSRIIEGDKRLDSNLQREMRDLDIALQREMTQLNQAQNGRLDSHEKRLDKKELLFNDILQRMSKQEQKTQELRELLAVKSADRFTGTEGRRFEKRLDRLEDARLKMLLPSINHGPPGQGKK